MFAATPTRTNVDVADLKLGDEIRRDGLKYRVIAAPEVEEYYADGTPACYRVPVELIKGRSRDKLLYEAGEQIMISRRTL